MADDTEDFAALFAASIKAKPLREGQAIDGTIVGIGAEVAFVDVGGKGEATIDLGELKDEDGRVEVSVGDRVHAIVVATSGGVRLSRRLARGAATDRQLEDAWHAGVPVEGRVEKAVKGGFEIRIGRQRAFCPISQIDTPRAEASPHEGRTYTFKIIEYREGGRNLVVSRRALIEAEQRAKADEVRRTIVPGAVLTGRVASVQKFGAFVELGGGVQGLLHVSEMGWSRVADPSELFQPGDEVTVKVLRVEADGERIALGLKQLAEDPWTTAAERYKVGDICQGRVTRLADFGAFVELEPGIEALAHASTFQPTGRRDDWSRQVAVGTSMPVEIVSIDLAKKRIGVAPAEGRQDVRDYTERAEQEGSGGFGTLGDRLRRRE